MVEPGLLSPTIFVVALLAAGTECVLVRIIFLVTRDASRCQFFAIDVTGVASITFDGPVRAAKRVFGFIVIEPDILPLRLIMAVTALRAKMTAMDIL